MNIAHAQTALQKENFEKNIALNLVKKYVTSIACDTSFERSSDTTFKTSLKDVFTIQAPTVETPDNNEAFSSYLLCFMAREQRMSNG